MKQKDKEKKRYKIAQKGFNGKHFLEVSCYIEESVIDAPNGAYIRYDDVVFFELSPDYKRTAKTTMLMDTNDLRALSYGIKELVKKGTSPFKKFTDPKRAGTDGGQKKLTLAVQGETCYINLAHEGKEIGFGFDHYAITAFSDTIALMAEECERMIFRLQQKQN